MEDNKKNLFPCVSSAGTPLFPAYTSQNSGTGEPVVTDKEWLTNSSYTPENYKETFLPFKPEKSPEVEFLEETKSKDKKKSKHSKKVKKGNKKSSAPSQEKFIVSESDSIRSQLNKKVFIEETGLSFERAYRVDSNKDSENIYYDSLEQKNTAKYHLYPKIPIGCNPEEKSVFKITPVASSKHDSLRYFSKKALKKLTKNEDIEEVSVLKDLCSGEVPLNYIPLTNSGSFSSDLDVEMRTKFEGVSVSWKFDSFKSQASSKKGVKQNDDVESPMDCELRNKIIQFNKKLSEFPHDIQLWLDFVEFQDELNKAQQSDSDLKSQTESYVTEKKVVILDKALHYNPKSVKLNVTKLNLCCNIWKIEKVIKCWEELIFLYPNDPQIWQEYVAFILTDLTYFNTPRVLKIYSKCLKTFSNLSEGIIQSHSSPPDVVPRMLDIFSQLCFVLHSCGYTEKAVASFQSLIELNLFRPTTTQSFSTSELVASFEPFWDSGAPRFGENEAIGWDRTVMLQMFDRKEIISQTDLSGVEDDILYEKLPEWETWLKFERLRQEHHWLPWRPNPEYDQTEDDIDDVDRTVSYEDISCFLFRVQDESHKFLLVEHFIKFLGFNSHNIDCDFGMSTKANISLENFDAVTTALNNHLFEKEIFSPLCLKKNSWNEDKYVFLKNVWSQAYQKFSTKHKHCVSLIYLKYLKTAFSECKVEPAKIKLIKKQAKNVVGERENRNCLPLWFELLHIEVLSGSKSLGRRHFETLLESSCSAATDGTISLEEVWYLVRSFIDLCLGYSLDSGLFSKNEIVWVLMIIALKKSYTNYSDEFIKPTLILKALKCFESDLESELESLINSTDEFCYCLDPWKYSALDCAKCYAFFQYFTQDLDAAINVLKNTSEVLEIKYKGKSKSYLIEQLHIFQAELMQYHIKHSTSSIKPLQNYLHEVVEKNPHNSRLLDLLTRLRHASLVISPTRRFFAKILREHHKVHPMTWIFAIASELSVSNQMMITSEDVQSSSGIAWKIRSLYEKALNTTVCKNIPLLWRSYIKFEMLNKELEKAKSVFHRAMQNCGWSKELLMDGIEYFPDDFKQSIDFMVEKQMRVHTPLEEITLLIEHHIQNL